MRAVVTRVKSASVSIGGAVHAQIGKGLLVLLAPAAPASQPPQGRMSPCRCMNRCVPCAARAASMFRRGNLARICLWNP